MNRTTIRAGAASMAILLTGAISACSSDSENSAEGNAELTFTHVGVPETLRPLFEPVIREYEAQNPNVKIKMQDLGWTDATNSVGSMAASKTLPDVMYYLPGDVFSMAEKGLVLDLTSKLKASPELTSDLPPGFLEAGAYQGRQYIIPSAGSTLLLWYNKDLFKEAGLDPDAPPTTWDGVLSAARQIHDKTGKPAFGMYGKATGGEITFLFLSMFASELGGPIWDSSAGKYLFADAQYQAQAVSALKHIQEMTKYSQSGISQYNRFENRTLFARGETAMVFDEIFMTRDVQKNIDSGSVGVAQIPVGPAGKSVSALDVGGWFIPTDAKNLNEAWDFLKFLMNTKNQNIHMKYGSVPILKSQSNDYTGPFWTTVKDSVTSAVPQGGSPDTRAIWQAMDEEIQKLLISGQTPEATLANINKRIASATGG